MAELTPEKVVRVQVRREIDEARIAELDETLTELHNMMDSLERRRDDIERGIRRRDEAVERATLTGPDPVEVVAQSILRAIHGDDFEAPTQVMETLRRYAGAVVVDLHATGLLNEMTPPDTTGRQQ